MEVIMGKPCPKCCNTSVWKYCEACEKYFCRNCIHKERTWGEGSTCPFCGKYGKLKDKEPK